MRDITTHVSTDAGDLRALVRCPDADGPLPGVVLIDGSGEGTADGWGQWPSTVAGCGAVVLSHDKPGCGGSPGDWHAQSFADRARESLAAVEVLRRRPGVDPDRVGLLGISQGAWITYLAAALAPGAVHQIVAVSAGVSTVEQERYRLELAVNGDDEAMAWVDERARRLLAGDDLAAVLADQRAYADRPWYPRAVEAYGTPGELAFVARNLGFDAADAMRTLRCPVFAAFGGADTYVPVAPSVEVVNTSLSADPRHALAVFPGADHNLHKPDRDRARPLSEQLTPGFLPMLANWLATT